MIRINRRIAIDESELTFRFVRATGPGGQNVNKVATAAQLRFDARRSPSLPDDVKARLRTLAGRRMTREGVVVITARRFRSQDKNRQDAIDRLIGLVRGALAPVRRRVETRPTVASKRRRLDEKHRRSGVKRSRRRPPEDD